MAHVTAIDTLDPRKHAEKGPTYHHVGDHGLRPEAKSEESNHDLEKHTSPEAGYELSQVETGDEQHVTLKAWVVVVVSYPSCARLCTSC